MVFTISNNGPLIRSTTYFKTPQARAGFVYLSGNAGAWRLLVPPLMTVALEEMAKASFVTVAPAFDETGQRVIDITFDDESEMPFLLRIGEYQVERALTPGEGRFLVYIAGAEENAVQLIMARPCITQASTPASDVLRN